MEPLKELSRPIGWLTYIFDEARKLVFVKA